MTSTPRARTLLSRTLFPSMLLFLAPSSRAQAPAPAGTTFVSYHQERPGLEVPSFTISVAEDGSATYHAELAPPKPARGNADADSAGQPAIDRTIHFSPATATRIFELARTADHFQIACASKAKNIADTGNKMLVYRGPDTVSQCAYNYSESKPIVALTDIFQQTEATLEIGRKLDFMRRFDRLGLDAEMATLESMLDAHQATEPGIISSTLRAVASDTDILQRVRLRASKLLQQADEAQR